MSGKSDVPPMDRLMRGLAEGIFGPDDLKTYARYMKPSRAPIDWAASCLLVVDTSDAFLGPDAPSAVASAERRTACGSPAWRALTPIRSLLAAFRDARLPIAFTMPDWDSEPFYGGTTIGVSVPARIADALAPGLDRRADELLLRKAKASAFFGTPLTSYLTRRAVKTLVLTGGTTSGCVRASAVDAASGGLDVVLVPDACFDRSDVSHRVSAFELATKYVRLASSSDVVEALSQASLEARASR